MKYIITILIFLPLLARPQSAIVDGSGVITNYIKYTDSIPGTAATGTRLRIKADSLAAALVASLALKSNLASPTFTGTVSGINSTMVGLGNVTNESKATMFTSPTFTGTPVGIGLPVYGRVTGSNFTTTGQTLVDITGLSVALAINATYEFEVNIGAQVTAVTTGNQYGIQYSAAGAAIEAQVTGSLTTTAAKTERMNALNTASTAYLTTSAQSGGVRITGIITTGANAGNITARTLKVTSGTSTVLINSFIKVTRIL